MPSIQDILAARSAYLKGAGGDSDLALSRKPLTLAIEHNYPDFELLRDELIFDKPLPEGRQNETCDLIFDELYRHGVIARQADVFEPSGVDAKRFLTGGWLEELAWHAALEAGADEARFSQLVGWDVKGFTGENEIDVILRRGERLAFISCKALRSDLGAKDRKHRARLMDAVHEADNLADHFGQPGEKVGVLVTTDLYDDENNQPRYEALMGKAAVLDVRIIPLEEIGWESLVSAFRQLLESSR